MDEKQIDTFSDLKAMQQIPYDLLSHVRLNEMVRPFRYRWETDAWSLNYEFTERLLKEFHLLRFSPKSPDKYLRDYGHNLGKLFCDLPKEDRQACELNYQEGIVDEAMKFGRKRNLQAFEGWLSVKYPRKGDYECHRISKMFEISTKELNQERKTFRHSLCQYASQHTVGEVFSWMEEQAQRKPTVMDIFPVPDVYFPVRTQILGSLRIARDGAWKFQIACLTRYARLLGKKLLCQRGTKALLVSSKTTCRPSIKSGTILTSVMSINCSRDHCFSFSWSLIVFGTTIG